MKQNQFGVTMTREALSALAAERPGFSLSAIPITPECLELVVGDAVAWPAVSQHFFVVLKRWFVFDADGSVVRQLLLDLGDDSDAPAGSSRPGGVVVEFRKPSA